MPCRASFNAARRNPILARRVRFMRGGRVRETPDCMEESDMKVSEAMTRDVRITSPDQTIQDAARAMIELDVGVLPVGEKDRLVGMLTDRDIAVRAVAEGKGPRTPVRDVM